MLTHRSSAACAIRRLPSGIWEMLDSCREKLEEAISLAKEMNDDHALTVALGWAIGLAEIEHNPAEVERLASLILEVSTRDNFAQHLAEGRLHRGWARSASGDGSRIPEIEQGIETFDRPGSPSLPYYLGLKAEALYLGAGRRTLSRQLTRRKRSSRGRRSVNGLRNCTGSVVSFSRRSVPRRFRLRLHSTKRSNRAGTKIGSFVTRAEASLAEYRHQKTTGSHGQRLRLRPC